MTKFLIFFFLCFSAVNAQEVYATFQVVAKQSANLAFNSSGIVDEVFVDVGSVVNQNDQLAILKNKDIKAMLHIYETSLKYAKKDYERQSQVQDLIDKAKFDNYEMGYEEAKAQVEYQQSLLDKTTLRAPFDGMIISKEIESGDVVSGQVIKTAFTIQSSVARKLILEFDQKYHSQVKVGDIFKYKLDGDDTIHSQKISKVYPYSNTSTRKIKAEVITKDLMVGLFGDGYIQVKK